MCTVWLAGGLPAPCEAFLAADGIVGVETRTLPVDNRMYVRMFTQQCQTHRGDNAVTHIFFLHVLRGCANGVVSLFTSAMHTKLALAKLFFFAAVVICCVMQCRPHVNVMLPFL